jgi:hypothetical protein
MTRERLRELPFDALYGLAEQYDVEIPDNAEQGDMVELVFDAIEELRLERESNDSNPVKIQEKKYDIPGDAGLMNRVLSESESETYDLPERYNETRAILMLRDPEWAYAYWDIHDGLLSEFASDEDFEAVILRVLQIDMSRPLSDSVLDSFDIEVQLHDSRWYIHLPTQSASLCIELISRRGGEERVLARSNSVQVPRGGMHIPDEEALSPAEEEILALSSIESFGVSSFGSGIPRRIMSLIDQFFID